MNKCTLCNGPLENGCLIDHSYSAALVQRYAKAEIPTDTKVFKFGALETQFNDIRRILAYRCTKCNNISLFAQEIVLIPNLNARASKFNLFLFFFIFLLVIGTFLIVFYINSMAPSY